MCRLGHEISYNVIYGSPLYIKFFPTDIISYEKGKNVKVLGALAN